MSHRALDEIVELHRRVDELDVLIARALAATAGDTIVDASAVAGLAQLKSERRRIALAISLLEDLG